ncbi:MAG: ferrous iron transport protein B, partial [Paludibacteraceae bacterium]|nr:ferrous iron transport protein B [Paludibacteraceae bacterium]
LLTGLPAKEAIVSSFAILYGGNLMNAPFTPVSAYAFLVFTLLYFPCIATISTIRKETNHYWTIFAVINSLLLAWLMAWLVTVIGHAIW